MISHVIIISYIALPHAHAHFDWTSASPHCSSAAEIFNFRLIRVHSNARNSISNITIARASGDEAGKTLNLNVSLEFVLGNIEILGKQNSLFPKGPVVFKQMWKIYRFSFIRSKIHWYVQNAVYEGYLIIIPFSPIPLTRPNLNYCCVSNSNATCLVS